MALETFLHDLEALSFRITLAVVFILALGRFLHADILHTPWACALLNYLLSVGRSKARLPTKAGRVHHRGMATKKVFSTVRKYAVNEAGKPLPDTAVAVIEKAAAKLKKWVPEHRRMAFEIGVALKQVRATRMGTEPFRAFIQEVAGLSLATAYNYMRVVTAYKKFESVPKKPFGRDLYQAAAAVVAKRKGRQPKARPWSAALWTVAQDRFLQRLDTNTKAALQADTDKRLALVSDLEKAQAGIEKALAALREADTLAKAS